MCERRVEKVSQCVSVCMSVRSVDTFVGALEVVNIDNV